MTNLWKPFYTVLAFDPGGRTGWGVIQVHSEALASQEFSILDNVAYWAADEYWGDEDAQVDEMMELAKVWPDARIVMEDFILRQFSRDRALLSPVRITAAFRHALRAEAPTRASRIVFQMEALALPSITDERMAGTDMWRSTRGKPHARDALRHGLTWLRRAKALRRTSIGEAE